MDPYSAQFAAGMRGGGGVQAQLQIGHDQMAAQQFQQQLAMQQEQMAREAAVQQAQMIAQRQQQDMAAKQWAADQQFKQQEMAQKSQYYNYLNQGQQADISRQQQADQLSKQSGEALYGAYSQGDKWQDYLKGQVDLYNKTGGQQGVSPQAAGTAFQQRMAEQQKLDIAGMRGSGYQRTIYDDLIDRGYSPVEAGQVIASFSRNRTPASIQEYQYAQGLPEQERAQFYATQGKTPEGTKQLSSTAMKIQDDALASLKTAENLNTRIDRQADRIAKGEIKLGPLANLISQGKNIAGMSTEDSRNFASFKADLEKMRNDSLRLNKGVQTEGDAQRAWNELFANLNDQALVAQRLQEIKGYNDQAMELQKLRIDSARQASGAGPYDFNQLFPQTSAGGGASNDPLGLFQ